MLVGRDVGFASCYSPISNTVRYSSRSGTPVGHDQPFEFPLIAEDVFQKRGLVVDVGTVDLGVARHDTPWIGLFDNDLEGAEINLPSLKISRGGSTEAGKKKYFTSSLALIPSR